MVCCALTTDQAVASLIFCAWLWEERLLFSAVKGELGEERLKKCRSQSKEWGNCVINDKAHGLPTNEFPMGFKIGIHRGPQRIFSYIKF